MDTVRVSDGLFHLYSTLIKGGRGLLQQQGRAIPDKAASPKETWPSDYSAFAREAEHRGCSGNKDEPVLTVRALVGGLLVGSLLCCSNTFFGLQTGWVTMGSLQVRRPNLVCLVVKSACQQVKCMGALRTVWQPAVLCILYLPRPTDRLGDHGQLCCLLCAQHLF